MLDVGNEGHFKRKSLDLVVNYGAFFTNDVGSLILRVKKPAEGNEAAAR